MKRTWNQRKINHKNFLFDNASQVFIYIIRIVYFGNLVFGMHPSDNNKN